MPYKREVRRRLDGPALLGALKRLVTTIEGEKRDHWLSAPTNEALDRAKKLIEISERKYVSKQAAHQKSLREQGMCIRACGRKALEGHPFCRTCGRKIRLAQRKRKGSRPRARAGCGRKYVY